MFRKQIFTIILITIIFGSVIHDGYGQENLILGDWRSHTSFYRPNNVEIGGDYVYAICGKGLFTYRMWDGEIERYSKVEGLSTVGISSVKYSPENEVLLLGYNNGNLDFLYEDEILTLNEIAQATSYNVRSIRNIHMKQDTAYLACDFGIVTVNVKKTEILNSYVLSTSIQPINVNDVTVAFDSIWVATEQGIYYAPAYGLNLHNYENWSLFNKLPNYESPFHYVELIKDSLVFGKKGPYSQDDTIYFYKNNEFVPFATSTGFDINMIDHRGAYSIISTTAKIFIYDKDTLVTDFGYYGGELWSTATSVAPINEYQSYIADQINGLTMFRKFNDNISIIPNSPYSDYSNQVYTSNNSIYITGGSQDTKYNALGLYRFRDNQWLNYNQYNISGLDTIPNLKLLAIDPGNPDHMFAATQGFGLVEFMDTNIVNVYNEKNSPLENLSGYDHAYINMQGLTFDQDKDLWMLVNRVANPLYLYTQNGEWQKYDFNGVLTNHDFGEMIYTSWGDLWIIDKDYGFVVVDAETLKSGDISNGYTRTRIIGTDNTIIGGYCTAIAEDNEQSVWLGLSSGGLAVYYNPDAVFYDELQAAKIIVEDDGIARYLLESEIITSIAIDGGNRKWIGTQAGGAFLISENGTREILNFNTENSPLPSNYVYDIGINHETGEVFFTTENGIASYFAGVTREDEIMDELSIFPNPIKENYGGKVTISGLKANTIVKITDVAGNLVFETESNGGTALWNMLDFNRQPVSTGVYLIYASTRDGSSVANGKLFVVKQ